MNMTAYSSESDAEVPCLRLSGCTDSDSEIHTTKVMDKSFFREATDNDLTLYGLKVAVFDGWPKTKDQCNRLIQKYWTRRHDIRLQNGLLIDVNNLVMIPTITKANTALFDQVNILKRIQNQERITQVLAQYMVNGWPKAKGDCHTLVTEYWDKKDQVNVVNGILFCGQIVILPTVAHLDLIENKVQEQHFPQKQQGFTSSECGTQPCKRKRQSSSSESETNSETNSNSNTIIKKHKRLKKKVKKRYEPVESDIDCLTSRTRKKNLVQCPCCTDMISYNAINAHIDKCAIIGNVINID